MGDIHDRQTVTIDGPAPERVGAGREPAYAGGRRRPRRRSTATPWSGPASELAFTFADADTGRPLDDLQPYLAAAGHVVVMRADGETFAHEHAEVEDADGDPVFALPGQRFGPHARRAHHVPHRLASTGSGGSSGWPTAR